MKFIYLTLVFVLMMGMVSVHHEHQIRALTLELQTENRAELDHLEASLSVCQEELPW